MAIQIDVKNILKGDRVVECNLYANDRCVKMFIPKADYNALMRDGFFIRDLKERDSSGVLNTTYTYEQEKS